jgi:rod shape-determining protein MreD
MKKFLFSLFLLLIALAIQSTLANYVMFKDVQLNLILLVVISISLIFGEFSGIIFGFFAGILGDFLFGHILGLFAFVNMSCGFISLKVRRLFPPSSHYIIPSFITIIITEIWIFLTYLISYFLGKQSISGNLISNMIYQPLINGLIMLIIHPVIKKTSSLLKLSKHL